MRPKLLVLILFTITTITTAEAQPNSWSKVWQALKTNQIEPIPVAAKNDGPPIRDGERVLFRFRAPSDAARVYLAGSFNDWARNNAGKVTDQQFAMQPAGNGIWFKRVAVPPGVGQYKFVVEDPIGAQQWVSDPHVEAEDKDGNTVFDFSTLPAPVKAQLGRTLKPFIPRPVAPLPTLDVRAEKVWARPDEANVLLVTLGPRDAGPGAQLVVNIETPFGQSVCSFSQPSRSGDNRLPIPSLQREGGFLARVSLSGTGHMARQGQVVLSVVQDVADDLRYGFYASYPNANGDYAAKAAMLAALHINAVEFYDYFPAHGYYAPREAQYKSEPFGISIDARDVQQKINAGHKRNILSLAYVASYAASQSIYRQHPDPMTDENGVPKIFNGQIMTEAEADRQKKDKWFWMMNVAGDSSWHQYILDEFGRALDDKPGDLVSFDGYELDTYGDAADTKFYAKSQRSGDLLTDVLHDFVGDVQALTHRIKPRGLVSFNSVNEFGTEKMSDVTDFKFLEIWDFYKPDLADIVDICTRNRAARNQRVILKLYPATMHPGQKTWPEATLRRLLGATMTGAGSLMVVGEPDEKSGQMHALNTLYYPDHQPVSTVNEQLLRDYYSFDAMLHGWTHGKDVVNTSLDNAIPDCITRTYAAPSKKALVVQMLNVQSEKKWTTDTPEGTPRKNLEVTLDLPGGVAPQSVLFASPDVAALQTPVKLDFDVVGDKLHTLVPELRVHGTLVLRY